jgi:hypothetical protein
MFYRLLLIFVAVTCPTARADRLSAFFQENPNVVANTDVFDHSAPTPAPGKPVYYLAVSAGLRDFGWPMPGEKAPESTDVLKIVTKILDGQGYKLVPAGKAPAIIIVYSWGTLYRNPDPQAPPSGNFVQEMLHFLGTYKASVVPGGPNMFQPALEHLGTMVTHGIYVMRFSAFDFAIAQKGVAKPLWTTNISNSTRGFYLPEILPTMLTVAAPLIGRETKHPVWINEHREGRVEFGPLKVIEKDVKLENHQQQAASP